MSYYPTLDEDLARAKEILAKGKEELPEDCNLAVCELTLISGADSYAAYKLLESFVSEIERLRADATRREQEKHEQFATLVNIRTLADRATGTDRSQGDPRESGALGAVKLLVERFEDLRKRTFCPDHNGECVNCDEWADQHTEADPRKPK